MGLTQRRIALLGLGVENRAVGDFFHRHAIPFAVCDRQAPADIDDLRQRWRPQLGESRFGPDYLDGLTDFDLAVRTPGLPYLHPALIQARAAGLECTSQTRLFFALCPAPIVGITGTKGKGTTASLLAAMLEAGPQRRLFLGGNIGYPPLGFLPDLSPEDRVVLELSSFQLQDLDRSPQVAVVLSITQDHLDHHADLDEYIAAKSAICRHQSPKDHLIYNADCPQASTYAQSSHAQRWAYGSTPAAPGAWADDEALWLRRPDAPPERLCALTDLPLPGRHNAQNAAAACAAAAACGASTPQIRRALQSFAPLPHRLEHIADDNGIAFYNDSLATTPDATVAALESFTAPVLLIAGGSSKGADFTQLAAVATQRGLKSVALIGAEAPRLQTALEAAAFPPERLHRCDSLEAAFKLTVQQAQAGDIVLLSPACASFGQFANYRDRGDRFRQLVLALPNSSSLSAESQ